jgi:hypothetical protein
MTRFLKTKFQRITSPLTGETYMVDLVQELGMELPDDLEGDHIPQEWIHSEDLRSYFKELEGLREEELHPHDEGWEESLALIPWSEYPTEDDEYLPHEYEPEELGFDTELGDDPEA